MLNDSGSTNIGRQNPLTDPGVNHTTAMMNRNDTACCPIRGD